MNAGADLVGGEEVADTTSRSGPLRAAARLGLLLPFEWLALNPFGVALRSIAIERTWLGFALGLAILMTGLLLGPRVPDAQQKQTCIGNVQLAGPFGFALNCDAPEFLWLARDPSGLLAPESPRQARPGLIVAAALMQAPLSLIVAPGGPPTYAPQGLDDPPAIAAAFARDFPAYLAYVLLNIGMLLASFLLLRKIIERGADAHDTATIVIVVSAGLMLVANDVTKAFVWSPHTQMLNILVPVLALYATLRAWSGAMARRDFTLALGLTVGLGMTAYPLFAVVPVCVALPAIATMVREPMSARRHRAAANLALLGLMSVVPSALWYLYVRAMTGTFFQFELAQGEVMWMAEAWHQGVGVFAAEWLVKLGKLLAFAAPQAIPLLVVVAWIVWTAARTRDAALGAFSGRMDATLAQENATGRDPAALLPIALAALYVSAALLGFYTCVGWTVERLAYPAIPPLVAAAGAAAVMLAAQLDAPRRRSFAAGFLVIALVQIAFEVAKDGPWS